MLSVRGTDDSGRFGRSFNMRESGLISLSKKVLTLVKDFKDA